MFKVTKGREGAAGIGVKTQFKVWGLPPLPRVSLQPRVVTQPHGGPLRSTCTTSPVGPSVYILIDGECFVCYIAREVFGLQGNENRAPQIIIPNRVPGILQVRNLVCFQFSSPHSHSTALKYKARVFLRWGYCQQVRPGHRTAELCPVGRC